jgi:NTE family protein
MKKLGLILLLTLLISPRQALAEDTSSKSGHPKVTVALGGGGGARGAAHIGVLRVLEQEKIPIDHIVGTSMGAIVGGLYAAGVSTDKISLMLHNKTLMHAFDTVPIPVRVAIEPFFLLVHALGVHPYDGLYRGNRFAKFINKSVPPEARQIESLKLPFWAVASDLLTGKPVVIKSGDFGRAIQASSAIPFLRRPVVMDDTLLVDGGVLANIPTFEARDTNADIIIAVSVDEEMKPLPKKKFKEFASVPNRSLSMVLDSMDKERLKAADVVIRPDVSGMSLLSTDVRSADRAIAQGELTAREALPKIRELMARHHTASLAQH